MRNGFWQKLATGLATLLATVGLTAWYALSQTVSEVKDTQVATGAKKLDERLEKVEDTVDAIKLEQAAAAGRDQLILEKLGTIATNLERHQERTEQ